MTDEDEDARNEEGRAMTDEGQRPTTMKNDNGETIIDEDGDARTTRRHRGGRGQAEEPMGIGTAIDEDEEWQATVADENGERMIEARRFMGDEMREATTKKKQDGTRCLTRMDVKLMLKSSQKKCNKKRGREQCPQAFYRSR